MSGELSKEYRNIALLGRYSVDDRRRKGYSVSEAHNIPHLRDVANLTHLVGDIVGFTAREKFLTFITGWSHDRVRSPSDNPDTKDDEISANKTKELLKDLRRRKIIFTNQEEQEAIAFAIKNHSKYPEWLKDPQTRNNTPESLKDKLWLALFVADKMTANGPTVIARRPSYQAGDKLRRQDGEWRDFGFIPDRDEGLVVAIESLLRLAFINPEGIYPDNLKPLVHPLYETQRQFVVGICRAAGLSIQDISTLLLNMTNQDGKSIFEVRKIKAPVEVVDLVREIIEKSGISEEQIQSSSVDLANSAAETVAYFSNNFEKDLDQLVLDRNPQNEQARSWQKEMIAHNNGSWLENKKIEIALEKNTPHDESLMPLTMGSPNRAPNYAIQNWGVPMIDERTVTDLYQAEWAQGTKGQLDSVSQAAERAGLGNHPELLRQKTAQVVKEILKNYPFTDKLRILDVGIGPGLSSLATWLAIPKELRSKVEMVLLDPSAKSLDAAEQLMKEHEIDYRRIDGVDLDIPQYLFKESVDILTGVASIHHHSRIPFDIYNRVLKPGGFAVFADWHNSIWENPASVYLFLQSFDWPKKTEGLAHFLQVYPKAKEKLPELSDSAVRQANEDITKFWLAYAEILSQEGDLGQNAIWPLEGHRPVERYVESMEQVGFLMNTVEIRRIIESGVVDSNPYQLLPDSSLLNVTIGQKP